MNKMFGKRKFRKISNKDKENSALKKLTAKKKV